MKVASIAVVLSAGLLAACASDGALAPLAPNEASLAQAQAGNPPPPRVLGNTLGSFSASSFGAASAQTFTFRGNAYYNRNLTTGMNFFETQGGGRIRANASGVALASGMMVLTNPQTGATLSVDLSQLVGFQGALFVPCPPGSAINCFALSATFTGTMQPLSGPPVSVTGTIKYRWES